VSKAVTPAAPSGLQRLRRAVGQRVAEARWLVSNAEGLSYWLAVAPVVSHLPSSLAYRIACRRGDWIFEHWAVKRAEIMLNLRQVLGDELSLEETERLTREFFRLSSCEVIDVMRLRGRARSLGKLVDIRGREHLDAALAGGKGVILCSAHFGSHISVPSLLHTSGYPLTTIGRWYWRYEAGVTSAERKFWEFVYARRVLRHRQRPNIEPWPGRIQVAAQAAAALRANEVVTICSDAEPLESDRGRTVEVPFLGRPATLLPGVVTLAKLTGAPVLMAFTHRTADYRHQVLEISPPVPMQGDTATAFGRCVTAIETEIRTHPANWFYWSSAEDLAAMGVLPPPPAEMPAATPEPAVAVPAALLASQRPAADQ
jgi:Kdo2-lipid IVA lauroyltransferase/acyltransferase